MKDFILLVIAGIIVFTIAMIALYQWDKRIAYGKEYMELRQDVDRLDKGMMEFKVRMNGLDRAIVAQSKMVDKKLKRGQHDRPVKNPVQHPSCCFQGVTGR